LSWRRSIPTGSRDADHGAAGKEDRDDYGRRAVTALAERALGAAAEYITGQSINVTGGGVMH
jgi:hypothetical protein